MENCTELRLYLMLVGTFPKCLVRCNVGMRW